MLLLWAVPGIFVLLNLRRQARAQLGLAKKQRVPPPKYSVLRDELQGPLVFGAIVCLWPLALLKRERVVGHLVARPWLAARTM